MGAAIRGRYGADGPSINTLPEPRGAVALPERAMGAQERARIVGIEHDINDKFRIDFPNQLLTVRDDQSPVIDRVLLGKLTKRTAYDEWVGPNGTTDLDDHTADQGFGDWDVNSTSWSVVSALGAGWVLPPVSGGGNNHYAVGADNILFDEFSLFMDSRRGDSTVASVSLMFRSNGTFNFIGGGAESLFLRISPTIGKETTHVTLKVLSQKFGGGSENHTVQLSASDAEVVWAIGDSLRVGVDVHGAVLTVWTQDVGRGGSRVDYDNITLVTDIWNDSSHQQMGISTVHNNEAGADPWKLWTIFAENFAGFGIEIYDTDGALVFGVGNEVTFNIGLITFTGSLGVASGGTGLTSYTLGDTLYASAATTLAKLAGNITTTKKFLTQTGTGAVSAAPGWNTIVAGDIVEGAVTQHQAALSIGAAQITAGTFGTGAFVFDNTVSGITTLTATTLTGTLSTALQTNVTALGTQTQHLKFDEGIGVDIGRAAATRPRDVHIVRRVFISNVLKIDAFAPQATYLGLGDQYYIIDWDNNSADNTYIWGRDALTITASEFMMRLVDTGGALGTAGGLLDIGTPFGTSVNTNMKIGLSIQQLGFNDQVLAFKSSTDVATVLTTAPTITVETDDYAIFAKSNAAEGGLLIQTMAEDAAVTGVLTLSAIGGTAGTTQDSTGIGLIDLQAAEHDGANALANITSGGNVISLRARVSGAVAALWLLTESGKVWNSGELEIDGDLNHDGSNIGFFGTAPAAQTAAYTQTFATATRTHANATGLTLTDSTGGTADQTLSAITVVGGSGATTAQEGIINDNFAEVADEINKLIADLANLKQLVNSVIDDGQTYGLLQ